MTSLKKLLIVAVSFIICPSAFAGYTAVCNVDGTVASIGQSGDYANADFIYSSPCPPTGANPDAVCITETEFNTAKAVPVKYLMCRNTDADPAWELLEEATQAEKDVVDAPEVAAEMERAAYATEVGGNNLCDATLEQIGSVIDAKRTAFGDTLNAQSGIIETNISGISNIAQARTVLTDMNGRYVTGFGLLADDLVTVTKQIGRCLKARSALGGI